MSRFVPVLFSALSLVLAGCGSSLYSITHKGEQGSAEGVGYLLPARFVRLTVERVALEPKDLKEAVTKTKAAVETTTAATKKAEEEAREAKRRADNAPAGKVKDDFAAAAAAAQTVANLRKGDQKIAEAALVIAEAKLAAAATKPKGSFEDRISLKLDPAVGDPCYHFSADMQHDIASDDSWTLKTTAEGLLTSSEGTSTNRYGDILVEFARLAGIAMGQGAGASGTEKRNVQYGAFKYERVFDVSGEVATCDAFENLAKLSAINTDLANLGTDIELKSRPYSGAADADPVTQLPSSYDCSEGEQKKMKFCVPGLAYRRSIPYLIEVLSCPTEREVAPSSTKPEAKEHSTSPCRKYVTQSVVAAVPNRARIEVIPYDTAAFVATKTKAEFADGMLTSAEATRPSELMEIVRTPGRMVEAAGKAIREVSPIQLDYTNRQRELAAAEAQFYEAQKKAFEARLAYEKAKADANAPH